MPLRCLGPQVLPVHAVMAARGGALLVGLALRCVPIALGEAAGGQHSKPSQLPGGVLAEDATRRNASRTYPDSDSLNGPGGGGHCVPCTQKTCTHFENPPMHHPPAPKHLKQVFLAPALGGWEWPLEYPSPRVGQTHHPSTLENTGGGMNVLWIIELQASV